jgi:hypothetical protein
MGTAKPTSARRRARRPHHLPARGQHRMVGTAMLAALLGADAGSAAAQQRQQQEPDRFLAECTGHVDTHGESSRLSDQCLPLAELPDRPKPLLELGEPFLGTGTLHKGIRLPGGAVWQPALLAFGTIRTAGQGGRREPGPVDLGEAVARFDLFGNLYLTQTERVIIGLRPLDRDGRFTGYTFTDPPVNEEGEEEPFQSELNAVVSTLFFEGDFAELFPNLDKDDSGGLDVYFSVGRQPLEFGDGMLMNEDLLDMIGLTRANMKIGSVVNTRVTGVFGWGQITRHGGATNVRDDEASLFGLFSELDLRSSTMQFDAAYVTGSDSTGSGIYAGFGDIRRFGRFNNTLRVLASFPIGDETRFNTQGVLIHNQFSWTSHHSHNFWYVGAFAGLEGFRSAARGPSAGGPAGATGVLFASPGIGRVGAPLGNQVDDAAGGSIGRQLFFAETRQQLLLEVGGRARIKDDAPGTDLAGLGARYQAAIGRRLLFVLEGSGAYDFVNSGSAVFGRVELVLHL